MSKFKVGDRVRVIITKSFIQVWGKFKCDKVRGQIITLDENDIDFLSVGESCIPEQNRYGINFCEEDFELIERSNMSRYEEIEQRIQKVEGWTKETDDLIQEIVEKGKISQYLIAIQPANQYCADIKEIKILWWARPFTEQVSFSFTTQCQKNQAFKQALLWLLDHSSIKKEEPIKAGDYVVGIDSLYFNGDKSLPQLGEVFIAGDRTTEDYVYMPNSGWSCCEQKKVRRATLEEIREYQKKQADKSKEIAELKKQVAELNRKIEELEWTN